jgi:hypothetical protein
MGFAGPNAIGWQDIRAFTQQTGLRFVPWELELIEALDDLYLGSMNNKITSPSTNVKGVVATASFNDGKSVKSLMGTMGLRRVRKKING